MTFANHEHRSNLTSCLHCWRIAAAALVGRHFQREPNPSWRHAAHALITATSGLGSRLLTGIDQRRIIDLHDPYRAPDHGQAARHLHSLDSLGNATLTAILVMCLILAVVVATCLITMCLTRQRLRLEALEAASLLLAGPAISTQGPKATAVEAPISTPTFMTISTSKLHSLPESCTPRHMEAQSFSPSLTATPRGMPDTPRASLLSPFQRSASMHKAPLAHPSLEPLSIHHAVRSSLEQSDSVGSLPGLPTEHQGLFARATQSARWGSTASVVPEGSSPRLQASLSARITKVAGN